MGCLLRMVPFRLHSDQTTLKKQLFHGDFDCPICSEKHKQLDLRHLVEDAQNANELLPSLGTILLNALKSFISKQMEDDMMDMSRSRELKYKSMNEVLCDDILESIFLFDGDRNLHRRVCRQWSQSLNELESIDFRNK